MEIIEEYQEIRQLYPLIKDTDASQAFNLMQKSNVLKSYLDEQAVDANKVVTIMKNEIDIVKSKESLIGDPKNSTNGNRKAMASDSYHDAIEEYAKAKSFSDLLERQIDFLKNVSYQTYTIWDNCKKKGERY